MSPAEISKLALRTIRSDRTRHGGLFRGDAPLTQSICPSLRRSMFLVGAPRSGTSFLGSCLAAVEAVSYHFEPILTKRAARWVYEESERRAILRLLYRSMYRWLMRIHRHGDRRFCEKTPRNCFIVPFLAEVAPDAQFVHIIRDGRDVALSYSKKPWLSARSVDSGAREPGGYAYGPIPRFWVEEERREEFRRTTDIHRCIWAWRRFVTAARTAGTGLGPRRYLEVRYEDLVEDPRATTDRITSFLGFDETDHVARFRSRALQAHSDSVGRWREELDSPALRTIDDEAGHLLRKLGYGAASPTR